MSLRLIIFFISIIFLSSCSLKRSLPEGGHLYIGSKVKVIKADKKTKTNQLEATYNTLIKQPKPNKTFLGVRWKLRRYSLFAKTNKRRTLKGRKNLIGKAPVVYDDRITKQMVAVMENKAFNEGFFNVVVSSKVKKRWNKARVKYTVELKEPFLVNRISNNVEDSIIRRHILQIQNASLIETDQLYSLQKLKLERERITNSLRQKGFYFFRADYLKFLADTINTKNQVKLNLVLKETADSSHLKPKTIHQIFLYPDLNNQISERINPDTLDYKGLKIIFQNTEMLPSVLRDAITLKKGQRYSPKKHQSSLERLSYLRNYQFIDFQFKPSEVSDTLLNVFIKLSPRKKEAIEGSFGLAFTPRFYIGPEVSLTYLNRNLFKGAEQFRVTTFGEFNFPIAKDLALRQEAGVKLSLSKPGMIIPFRKKDWPDKLIAKTKIELAYSSEKIRLPLTGLEDLVDDEPAFMTLSENLAADPNYAPFIALNKLELNLAYQWRKRIDILHELSPVNFTFQIPRYENLELKLFLQYLNTIIPSENLQLNLEKMFILKPSYSFLYDSRLKKTKAQNYFYLGKLALAGNKILSPDNNTPLDVLESQFLQLENDFRYFRRFSKSQTIAARFAIKASIPFKNEVILPFFDLYTLGGPNGVRAFRPRSVGPGSVEPVDQLFFISGTGDFHLESNLEWRPKLNDFVELGFFIDAGNVWLFKGGIDNNELATFRFKNFYKQLAIGTGVGLRLDFEIIIFRLDFATPLTKPWLPEGDRWVGDKITLGNFNWLRENLTLNLGFGYSF